MALIKHANSHSMVRDAIVLDLGDLQRQAAALVTRAQAQAGAIITEAEAERDRIIGGAQQAGHDRGFAQGLEEGRAQGHEEGRALAMEGFRTRLDVLESVWTDALLSFNRHRDELVQLAERDVIRLAVLIAERVIKRSITLDQTLVVDQLRAVLGVVVRPTELVISVHPGDREMVESALPVLLSQFPSVRHADITEDPALQPGSVVARTRAGQGMEQLGNGGGAGVGGSGGGAGEIDASITTQLDRIVEVLLPDRGKLAPGSSHGGESGAPIVGAGS